MKQATSKHLENTKSICHLGLNKTQNVRNCLVTSCCVPEAPVLESRKVTARLQGVGLLMDGSAELLGILLGLRA